MAKRKIIKIDEEKCNGCGLCIPNCPEGALQIIDGKARLISDLFCDGLGACIGHCPQGAITIEEREAEEYEERKVMANIVKQGKNVIKAHLRHLKEHKQDKYLKQALDYLKKKGIESPLEDTEEEVPTSPSTRSACSGLALSGPSARFAPSGSSRAQSRDEVERASHGHSHTGGEQGVSVFSGCPGSKIIDFRKKEGDPTKEKRITKAESQLRQWPIQIMLLPPLAPYLQDADLLIAADCVPFAYADFHQDLLKDKILLVGCPKLDDVQVYQEKINQILKNNKIKSITYAHMEVPCCFGLVEVIKNAISASGKGVPFKEVIISIKGERIK